MFIRLIIIALVRLLGPATLALSLLPASPAAADITTTIDRNPVETGETFVLSFRIDGDGDAEPDFSPLERDFEIVNRSQGSQFAFTNGQASRTTEWQLALMPKHDGMLAIPAIDFGAERSKPLTVTVRAASHRDNAADAGQGLIVEMEAEPKNPYVQAQTVLSVRVLGRQAFGGNLSDPQADNVLLEKLGDDRRFNVTRDGVTYTAIERKYALFPQKSGHLHLDPVTLNAEISDGRPQFGGFLGRGTRAVRLQSQPLDLEVRPIPPNMSGKSWLPAESLELTDSWERGAPQINVGEPLTRTMTAVARGATVGVLPELARAPGGPAGAVKQYPDQPVLNEEKHPDGLISSRQEKTALIVNTPGSFRLPAVEVHWWNTKTDREEVARIPERLLSVGTAADQPQPVPPQTPPAPLGEPAPSEPPTAPPDSAPAAVPTSPGFWPYLALGLGIGWLLTIGAWVWASRHRTTSVMADSDEKPASDPSERSIRQQLEQACRSNDPAAARRMLVLWLARLWRLPAEAVPAALRQRGTDRLAEEFVRLDATLFGPSAAPFAWQGGELWSACQSLAASGKPTVNETLNPLEPLHRLPT